MSESADLGGLPPAHPRRVFTILIIYRWLSLLPPLAALLLAGNREGLGLLVFFLAAGFTGLISLFNRQLNRALQRRPWLLLLDLLLMAGLVAASGGWHSPYYLHSLNPLLVAAFFFRFRGGLLASAAFLPLYSLALFAGRLLANEPWDWLTILSNAVGFFLISGAVGYASSLVASLGQAHDRLAVAHRDLGVIHDLIVSLQSAADVEEVQERVLEAVTTNLGFRQAVVGLVDQERNIITGWLGRMREGQMPANGGLPHVAPVPLSPRGGAVAEALLQQSVRQAGGQTDPADAWISSHFGLTAYRIFPMMLREHPVGVLLVDASEGEADATRLPSLEAIARQAAVAVGTTMLCIDRAQRLAVQDERLRIAQEIHDTVSQSLFGIVYTLDGSLALLPEHPEMAIPELTRALHVAEEAHQAVRHSILNIWPSEITADRFVADLRKYLAENCRAADLQLSLEVDGDFGLLSSQAKRGLYRIAQEALANVAHHAAATEARVRLAITPERSRLRVQDNGRGFDPAVALSREYSREHFGLRGMQQRASALGGTCAISSQPGSGATILVDIANEPGEQ